MATCHERNVSFPTIVTLLDTGVLELNHPSPCRNAFCRGDYTIDEKGMVCVWTFLDGLLYLHVPF
jgi:hypothetical protein